MPDPTGEPKDPRNPLGLDEESLQKLHERLDRLREQARRIAGSNTGDSGESRNVRTVPDWIYGPYVAIPDPGPDEARMLQAHPDWAVSHPWRLLSARDGDIRQRQVNEAVAARDHWEFVKTMEGVEEEVFREVVDLEVDRLRKAGQGD